MKVYFYVYDSCVFYEIILLGYFLKETGHEVFYCSDSGREITAWEGMKICPDLDVKDIPAGGAAALIIPGGLVENVDKNTLFRVVKEFVGKGLCVGGICAGSRLLKECGVLVGLDNAVDGPNDCVSDGNIITACPNKYVDFALEVGRCLNIFSDEADYQETVDFFKYFKNF